jgi:hypothetical protein
MSASERIQPPATTKATAARRSILDAFSSGGSYDDDTHPIIYGNPARAGRPWRERAAARLCVYSFFSSGLGSR